ncbi:MAG: transposase [Pirellulales bacterium]|nr:transposase [Pirellulales bacterium]
MPRSLANEQSFGVPHCRSRCRGRRRRADQRKALAPRVRLTMLWHVGSGLPWSWTRGASDASERTHLLEMLNWLPERSLLTADAGFVGYEFWQTLQDAGHDFLIRVGANVRLLKQLGYYRECAGRVYLWPDAQARRQQPPIVLRLIVAQGERHPVYLVTSVLAKSALSDRQLLEIYRARWSVEVFYRSFKQTFGRHKLRCAASKNVLVELDWSLAAIWTACLYAKHQQLAAGEDLAKTSVASVLRILRRAMRETDLAIGQLLATALVDSYHRAQKSSRAYPRKKTDPPSVRPPVILKACKTQIALARAIKG